MATSSASGAGLSPLIAQCENTGALAAEVACSVEDFLDSLRNPSLLELLRRLRQYTNALEQLQHQLDQPPPISARLQLSIKTSLDTLHESLAHLRARVAAAQVLGSQSDDGEPKELAQIWPPGEIRSEGRVLGIQLQTVTLLMSSIQENSIDCNAAELPVVIGDVSHPANISTVSNPTPRASPSPGTPIQVVSNPRLKATMSSPRPKTLSLKASSIFRNLTARRSSSLLPLPSRSFPTPRIDSMVIRMEIREESDVEANSNRREVARSQSWKWSFTGRQLASQLCQACEEDDHEWVQALLKRGAYVNGHQTDGESTFKTPLILALERGSERIVSTLLENGADAKGTKHKPPICLEMDRILCFPDRPLQLLQLLLDYGANVHEKIDGESLILTSVKYARPDLVNFLLNRGANARNEGLLERSMKLSVPGTRARDIAESLLQAGASPNQMKGDDFNPLQYAIMELQSARWVELLVSHGAILSMKCRGKFSIGYSELHNPSFLHLAAYVSYSTILESLLARNLDTNVTCRSRHVDKITPLHLSQSGRGIRLLVQHGADISAQDSFGETPLFWASRNIEATSVRTFLELGSAPNARDFDGGTALHLVLRTFFDDCESGELTAADIYDFRDCVEALLDAGARVDLSGPWEGKYDKKTVHHIMTTEEPTYHEDLAEDAGFDCEGGLSPTELFEELRAMVTGRRDRLSHDREHKNHAIKENEEFDSSLALVRRLTAPT